MEGFSGTKRLNKSSVAIVQSDTDISLTNTRNVESSEDGTSRTPIENLTWNGHIATKEAARDASEVPALRGDTTSLQTSSEDANYKVGQTVLILKSEHKGKQGKIIKVTDKMVKVSITGVTKPVSKRKTSVQLVSSVDSHPLEANGDTMQASQTNINTYEFLAGEEWHLPDSGTGGTRFGSRIIMKLRTLRQGTKRTEQNFLTHLFQDRLMVIETPMNQKEMGHPFDVKIVGEGGFGYELLSSKVQSDGDASGGP